LLATVSSLAVVLASMVACSAGPSDRPAVALRGRDTAVAPPRSPTGPRPLPPLDQPGPAAIQWDDCTAATRSRLPDLASPAGMRFQCGRITNALDSPNKRGRGTSKIALLKAGSGSVPLVVVNDAAGEPGTLRAARLATELPATLLTTFSLIGMDRRGTGGSDAAQCVPDTLRSQALAFDPNLHQQSDLTPMLDTARAFSEDCVLDLDTRLPAYDSWHTAADLERLRQELGARQLNALGIGDGSRVLSLYAERYPAAVGRMVLDGVPDPTVDGVGQAEAEAAGAEQTFDVFAGDCTAHGCPLAPDPKAALRSLVDQLRRQPVTAAGGLPVTPGIALHAVLAGLADRTHWTTLASALAAARTGDVSGLVRLVRPQLGGGQDGPARFDAAVVTGCNDTMTRTPVERVASISTDWQGKYPLFGGVFAQQLLLCAAWPVPAQPLPTPRAQGAPPILVLSTAADPFTPQQGTARAATQLESAVLVGWQGSGHGAFPHTPCITSVVQLFLVDARVPANNGACPA
jgi:pimeloyl-ACP methyl ester carboxylesterase